MEGHEKEKRGKVAELMYELLDFGRMEQLARDIWDKAPEGMKTEVAGLFASRVKAEIQRQAAWSEPKVDQYGRAQESPPKPMMQTAFENVVKQLVEKYMHEHAAEIRTQLVAAADAQVKERIEKESSYLLDAVFRKAREGFNKALDGRGY